MASWYSLLAWYWFARLNNTCSDTYEESGTSSIHDVVQMSTLWVHTCVHYSTCMVKVCQFRLLYVYTALPDLGCDI